MNTATLDRFPGINNFIVCFYCNETFLSLSSLLTHCCSAEPKISLDFEPFETLSDSNSIDFDQADSVNSTETSSDRPLDYLELEMAETDSNMSDVGETSLSGTETEAEDTSEVKSNETSREISELASCASEKCLMEPNTNLAKEMTELGSNASVKQLLESNTDTREDNKLINEASKNQIPDTGQKVCEHDSGNEFNSTSYNVVKASGLYEKLTNPDTSVSCSKFSSTKVGIQSSHVPLHTVESDFQKRNDTQMESIATDKSLSSETSGDNSGKNKLQEESSILKHNIEGTDGQTSDIHSRPSAELKSDSCSNSWSSSMEIEMGCGDDPADSETSNSLPKNKSDVLKHDHVQNKFNAFEGKSEENLNTTKNCSETVTSCYVKVQDIFKSILDTKVSPKKIFSWKKKYHVCDVCNKFFRLRSDLNIHYLIHSTLKPYACNICNKSFVKQCNLFTHHLVHTIKRKHSCSICKKSFLKKSLLLRHKLTHTKERPFTCQKCDKSYASKWSLNEHYLTHSDERPYVCEICDATFSNKRYLRKHYHSHQSKNNECEFCFRTFKRKHHLEEHYNIHTNDRPHQCKICNKTFHLLLTLNNHYTVVHRNQYAQIFSRTAKTSPDCKTDKKPVIQKIQAAAGVEDKKIPVVENPSVIHIKKENLPISRARRKPLIPKRYLQPDKKL